MSAVGWAYWLNDHWHLCADEPTAHERRQRVHLAEDVDALEAERDRLRQQLGSLASEEEWRDLYLRERAERDRAKEAVHNLDKALRNAVKERGDALDERDRLREALKPLVDDTWPNGAPFIETFMERTDWRRARAALDSDPDLAERTQESR